MARSWFRTMASSSRLPLSRRDGGRTWRCPSSCGSQPRGGRLDLAGDDAVAIVVSESSMVRVQTTADGPEIIPDYG